MGAESAMGLKGGYRRKRGSATRSRELNITIVEQNVKCPSLN